MNEVGGKLKDENKQSNRCRLFSFDAGNHVIFRAMMYVEA
jgi:hypothetical protein